jgi:hypothetical protein
MLVQVCLTVVLTILRLVTPLGSSAQGPASDSSHARADYRLLVAWAPEDLPASVEGALDAMEGVTATTVRGGVDWLTASRSPSGKTLNRPAPGYAIPLDVGVIEPSEYSRLVESRDAQAVRSLSPGEILLSATEAELRGGGKGLQLSVGRELRVSGTVSDRTAQGYEGLISQPVPSSWPNANRFVLIKAQSSVHETELRQVIERNLTAGQHLVLRSQNQTRFLRFADAVQPQLIIKRNFGEFSARRLQGGKLQIEEQWIAKNIKSKSVPILGRVTCHRKLFPQLIAALTQLQGSGLSHTIDPSQFAGCFNSRYVAALPGTRISHHSWGVALDINSRDNPFGSPPHQDPRLVRTMRRWGLTWGGTWAVPDGMHFEWMRFHR